MRIAILFVFLFVFVPLSASYPGYAVFIAISEGVLYFFAIVAVERIEYALERRADNEKYEDSRERVVNEFLNKR